MTYFPSPHSWHSWHSWFLPNHSQSRTKICSAVWDVGPCCAFHCDDQLRPRCVGCADGSLMLSRNPCRRLTRASIVRLSFQRCLSVLTCFNMFQMFKNLDWFPSSHASKESNSTQMGLGHQCDWGPDRWKTWPCPAQLSMDGIPPGILWLTLAANEEKSHHLRIHLGHLGWLSH